MTLPPLVRLLRPHQYTKNLLVFAAPGAAGRLDEGSVLARSLAAFALFCVVSSIGYVVNDLADAEADRRHPKKRHRPIASGAVSPGAARAAIGVLALIAIVAAPLLDPGFALVLAGYLAVSLVYSNILKRVPWIELAAVSAGFVLRAIGGGAASDTPLSGWFIAVISAGALLLITGKRLGELLTIGDGVGSRSVLTKYSVSALRLFAVAAAFVAVGGYAAWAAAEASDQAVHGSASWLLRATAVPFGITIGRFLQLSWTGRGEAPDLLAVTDPIVILSGLAWAATYALGLYA